MTVRKYKESSSFAARAAARGDLREADGVNDYLLARSQPALYVLDRDYRVISYWLPSQSDEGAMPQFGPPDGTLRLDPAMETQIRQLTATWADSRPDVLAGSSVAVVAPSAVIRAMPLFGPNTDGFIVTIERIKTRNAIEGARRRFALSPRELDVLTLVLEGCDTPAVAIRLHIARSTANDHVKRMLAKTGSRNRAELVARVLGWNR
ncbi:MAG TPA: helix-turn-helix transcriptional regulator [Candidatus Acidoferrales bacterium]|nr:helix-turn-helix transcriptional regulator [Candidatus Acidoferrales bacterium]